MEWLLKYWTSCKARLVFLFSTVLADLLESVVVHLSNSATECFFSSDQYKGHQNLFLSFILIMLSKENNKNELCGSAKLTQSVFALIVLMNWDEHLLLKFVSFRWNGSDLFITNLKLLKGSLFHWSLLRIQWVWKMDSKKSSSEICKHEYMIIYMIGCVFICISFVQMRTKLKVCS